MEGCAHSLIRIYVCKGTPHLGRIAHKPAVWLYRGAWMEYHVHEADVFVPLSQVHIFRISAT